MKLIDSVYGEFEIENPLLEELISCQTVQRLKGISQQGLPECLYHKKTYSRYEHSVGVLILLTKLGADNNEQIAGLLHDISHTAFSHLIDWVLGDPSKEDHQDSMFAHILKQSEIPTILNTYGIHADQFYDLEQYSLLEQDAPHLCADRIDYTLREMALLKHHTDIAIILNDLTTHEGIICFKTIKGAEIFAKHYAYFQKHHWAGIESKA
ncbi:MAG: HD domain-containing protein [Candidatus Woesearchaeota archaeon]